MKVESRSVLRSILRALVARAGRGSAGRIHLPGISRVARTLGQARAAGRGRNAGYGGKWALAGGTDPGPSPAGKAAAAAVDDRLAHDDHEPGRDEWTVRLPVRQSPGLATAFLVYLLGATIGGRGLALAASMAICTMWLFITELRQAGNDGPLGLFTTMRCMRHGAGYTEDSLPLGERPGV